VTCYGRGAVPRSGYGRREIEGPAVVEEPPRLTRQLVKLARCLLALGLDEQRTLALVYKASLDSMPRVRARALAELAHGEPLLASELAWRIGAHRHVARTSSIASARCSGSSIPRARGTARRITSPASRCAC